VTAKSIKVFVGIFVARLLTIFVSCNPVDNSENLQEKIVDSSNKTENTPTPPMKLKKRMMSYRALKFY